MASKPGCTTGNALPKTDGPTNQKLRERSRTSTHVAPSSARALGPGSSWPSARKSCQPVWKSKIYGAFVLNHRVVFHAIDATPARWRGDADSSPLDGASTAASSPGNDLVKNYRVRSTYWLNSTQLPAVDEGTG